MGDTDYTGLASLIIAIVAFIVSSSQALQQFAASAEGYRRCREGIMGRWGTRTRRVFTLEEFRFRVEFFVPVLFISVPSNRKGPVVGKEVLSITGTTQSMEDTYCRSPGQIEADMDRLKRRRAAEQKDGPSRIQRVQPVHTADDEKASWVLLLETLQEAERKGREWNEATATRPRTPVSRGAAPSTYVVQLQERRRTWDEMPSGIEKPFATTTIGHLVVMANLLGMTWKAFDQDAWNLRAEGNGLMLLSHSVGGSGLAVKFSKTGIVEFQRDRIIPCPGVNYLCFGSVDTFIKDFHLQFEPRKPNGDYQPFTRRTLRGLHCDRITIQRYLTKRNHIRSVSFELIAMLSKVYRERGSNFRRLPNPTPDHWIASLDACALMEIFQEQLAHLATSVPESEQMRRIRDAWQTDLRPVWRGSEAEVDIDLREAVHTALDACDAHLTRVPTATVLSVVGAHLTNVLQQIADALSPLSTEHDTAEELLEHYFHELRPKIIEVREEPAVEVRSDRPPGAAQVVAARRRRLGVFSADEAAVRHDVWITLIFRMCCWWILHDFDEAAVMMIPPRLQGSRLPLFIL